MLYHEIRHALTLCIRTWFDCLHIRSDKAGLNVAGKIVPETFSHIHRPNKKTLTGLANSRTDLLFLHLVYNDICGGRVALPEALAQIFFPSFECTSFSDGGFHIATVSAENNFGCLYLHIIQVL